MYIVALLIHVSSLVEAEIIVKRLNALNQEVFFKFRQNSSLQDILSLNKTGNACIT
jgi:hypothetical protein